MLLPHPNYVRHSFVCWTTRKAPNPRVFRAVAAVASRKVAAFLEDGCRMEAMTETQTTAKAQIARARATERMRRSRARRREGLRCCTLFLRDSEIAALIRLGLLPAEERENRIALVKAMHAFLERAFDQMKPPPYLAALERAGLAKGLGGDVMRNLGGL
jgi:hypothetical protein